MNCTDYWYIKFGVHIEEGYYVMTYLVCLEVCRHVAIFITLFLCSVQFADLLQFCWPYFYPLCLIRCVLQTCCSFPDLIFILCVWFAVSCRLLQFWWPYFYTLCLICCVLQFWWHYFYTLCLICWVLLTCCSFYDFIFILWVWFSVCCWLVAVFMTLFLYFVFDLLCCRLVAVLMTFYLLYFVLIRCVLQTFDDLIFILCVDSLDFAVLMTLYFLKITLCVDLLGIAVLMILFLYFVLIRCVLQTFAAGGLGSIMRVLTDRKRVWFYVLRCSLSRAVLCL